MRPMTPSTRMGTQTLIRERMPKPGDLLIRARSFGFWLVSAVVPEGARRLVCNPEWRPPVGACGEFGDLNSPSGVNVRRSGNGHFRKA